MATEESYRFQRIPPRWPTVTFVRTKADQLKRGKDLIFYRGCKWKFFLINVYEHVPVQTRLELAVTTG